MFFVVSCVCCTKKALSARFFNTKTETTLSSPAAAGGSINSKIGRSSFFQTNKSRKINKIQTNKLSFFYKIQGNNPDLTFPEIGLH